MFVPRSTYLLPQTVKIISLQLGRQAKFFERFRKKFNFQTIDSSILGLIEENLRDFVPQGDENKKKQKN